MIDGKEKEILISLLEQDPKLGAEEIKKIVPTASIKEIEYFASLQRKKAGITSVPQTKEKEESDFSLAQKIHEDLEENPKLSNAFFYEKYPDEKRGNIRVIRSRFLNELRMREKVYSFLEEFEYAGMSHLKSKFKGIIPIKVLQEMFEKFRNNAGDLQKIRRLEEAEKTGILKEEEVEDTEKKENWEEEKEVEGAEEAEDWEKEEEVEDTEETEDWEEEEEEKMEELEDSDTEKIEEVEIRKQKELEEEKKRKELENTEKTEDWKKDIEEINEGIKEWKEREARESANIEELNKITEQQGLAIKKLEKTVKEQQEEIKELKEWIEKEKKIQALADLIPIEVKNRSEIISKIREL